jgi:hypothetical protein
VRKDLVIDDLMSKDLVSKDLVSEHVAFPTTGTGTAEGRLLEPATGPQQDRRPA